jgi:glucuronate isomerase
MERGLIPLDYDLIGKMTEDICYNNVKAYFNL